MPTMLRSFRSEADFLLMSGMARACPTAHPHVVDLPYRFSSWSAEQPENTALWVDQAGQLQGWAVMQAPFWTVDIACRPEESPGLYAEVLAWADRRARQLSGTPYEREAWYVNVFSGQAERIRDLEDAGFFSQANLGEHSWSEVLLQHAGGEAVLPAFAAQGYTIRPLNGPAELEAYVELHQAVFETKNMTLSWRARTLRQPAYTPALDLVAEAPDGTLAAFCIGWHAEVEGGHWGQIEPLGVHPAHQGRGLGKAILAETLRRLYALGVDTLLVQTDSYRGPALKLYEASGFRPVQDILIFRRDYAGSER